MDKALLPGGDTTLDALMNSITRKVMRGEVKVGDVIYMNRTGEGILPNGRHAIARIRGAFKVDILREIETVEVKPARED